MSVTYVKGSVIRKEKNRKLSKKDTSKTRIISETKQHEPRERKSIYTSHSPLQHRQTRNQNIKHNIQIKSSVFPIEEPLIEARPQKKKKKKKVTWPTSNTFHTK